jgi:hypothetical protein
LKLEAADVQKKVEETDVVMAEVESVSQQYLPLSAACSSMYFTLESLNQVRILAYDGSNIENHNKALILVLYMYICIAGYPC